jgi:putative membrane protein
MAAFLSVCVALAISALYELIEWWAALALGQGADEFLGTQGDPWDTQSDMFLALVGLPWHS